MDRIVESYEEPVVVTTAKRLVHVVEETSAHVEAWHGGRLVDTLGGWTSTKAAIRDAEDKARWFGVGTKSSMSIVVREEIRRSRVLGDRIDPVRRGETLQRAVTVAESYVHDAVFGPRILVPRTVAFEWAIPVQFARATDWPGESLKDYFRALAVRGWRPEFLHDGFGYRDFRIDRTTSRPALSEEVPPDAERRSGGGRSECWVVAFEGRIEMLTSVGTGMDSLLHALTAERLELDVLVDWQKDNSRIRSEGWSVWTGAPATRPMVWRPVSAQGAAERDGA